MRASLPSFSGMIFEQDLPVCGGILLNNTAFQFPGVRGGLFSFPALTPLPPLHQACCLVLAEPRAFHLLFIWICLENTMERVNVQKTCTGTGEGETLSVSQMGLPGSPGTSCAVISVMVTRNALSVC